MTDASALSIKVFADGADIAGIRKLVDDPMIAGITTNPTLMRKAGIDDYERFATELLEVVPDRPISFEVFSDDFAEMERQALKISGWADNVYVKVPITNTEGASSLELVRRLSHDGRQAQRDRADDRRPGRGQRRRRSTAGRRPTCRSSPAASPTPASTPMPIMVAALDTLRPLPGVELIWASPARCSTSCRPTASVATSSRSPTTCWRSCTCWAATSTSSRSTPCACSTATPAPPVSPCRSGWRPPASSDPRLHDEPASRARRGSPPAADPSRPIRSRPSARPRSRWSVLRRWLSPGPAAPAT